MILRLRALELYLLLLTSQLALSRPPDLETHQRKLHEILKWRLECERHSTKFRAEYHLAAIEKCVVKALGDLRLICWEPHTIDWADLLESQQREKLRSVAQSITKASNTGHIAILDFAFAHEFEHSHSPCRLE